MAIFNINPTKIRIKNYLKLGGLVLGLIFASLLSSCSILNGGSPTTLLTACSFDGVSGGNRDAAGNWVISSLSADSVATGWLANSVSDESPDEITLVVAKETGEFVSSRTTKNPYARPDVADSLQSPRILNSGFSIPIMAADLIGPYQLTLQGKFSGQKMACNLITHLIVNKE